MNTKPHSLKYFGLIYFIFLIVLIGLGITYLNNITLYSTEKVLGELIFVKDTAKVESDLPLVKGTVTPPVDVFQFLNPKPELIEKGKELYAMNCSSCHGSEGKGDGVAGINLNPKARNFQDMNGWTNGTTIYQMYKTLQEGIVNRGMPSYSNLLPEARFGLIMYMRTFNKDYPAVTEAQLKSIDSAYSLSKGIKLPNQIPVKLAGEKILSESKPLEDKLKIISSAIEKNTLDSGAVLFKNISLNVGKSVTVLSADTSWKSNEKAFLDFVMSNPINSGFRSNVYVLTSRELKIIQKYLVELFVILYLD